MTRLRPILLALALVTALVPLGATTAAAEESPWAGQTALVKVRRPPPATRAEKG